MLFRDYVMLTKIVGSYCACFDNLLAQTIIAGMRINIDATNSEAIQRMPELISASKLFQYLFVKTKQQH